MNELRDFKGIFRKDVTYDNFKSYKKKTGIQPLSEKYNFAKPTGRFKASKENMLTSERLFWDIAALIKIKYLGLSPLIREGIYFFPISYGTLRK